MSGAIVPFDQLHNFGEVMARSGFFQDARDVAQAIVKIQAGAELGFAPVQSMMGIHVIKGKVTLSANLMAAAVKRSGRYNFRVVEHTPTVCRIAFFEGGEQVGESGFTIEEARAAGLLSNQTWKSYPRNMLYARAMSNGVRWYCPDVTGGAVYTPEELGAEVNADGEAVNVEAPPPVVTAAMLPAEPREAVLGERGAARLRARLDAAGLAEADVWGFLVEKRRDVEHPESIEQIPLSWARDLAAWLDDLAAGAEPAPQGAGGIGALPPPRDEHGAEPVGTDDDAIEEAMAEATPTRPARGKRGEAIADRLLDA